MYRGKIKQIHFVGIGGIGMSGIAEVLLNLGYRITGSDAKKTEITRRLARLGCRVTYDHQREHVQGADVVVTSSAIKKDNPEVQEAKARREYFDNVLDDCAKGFRLKLAATGVDASTKAPYTAIFHRGIDYYTEAGVDEEVTRYRELVDRIRGNLAEGDPLREETVAAIEDAGQQATAQVCDVRDPESVKALAEGVAAAHGRCDVLVNNVGDFLQAVHKDSVKSDSRNISLNGVFMLLWPSRRAGRA